MKRLTPAEYQGTSWIVSMLVSVNVVAVSLVLGALPTTVLLADADVIEATPEPTPAVTVQSTPESSEIPAEPSATPTVGKSTPSATPTVVRSHPAPAPDPTPTKSEPTVIESKPAPSPTTTKRGPVGARWSTVRLNVRDQPAGDVLTTVEVGTKFVLTGEVEGIWSRTDRGWVMTKYLANEAPPAPKPKPRPTTVEPKPKPRPTVAPPKSKPRPTTTTPKPKPKPQPPKPPVSDAVPEGTTRVIFECVNRHRANAGLPALTYNAQLAGVANRWTKHMADVNTMSHNPTLGRQVPSWRSLGENVGYTTYPTPGESLCRAWMDSAGHRDNILSPKFTETGIGVVVSGRTTWATQDFLGR